MSDLVATDQIETIVGARRHATGHLARAVSAEQTVYVLHSVQCLTSGVDLRLCEYSLALDRGIDADDWHGWEDAPVVVDMDGGLLVPLARATIPALTLTQPWASLVALAAKRIETRSWRTGYRGTLAIHAAKGLPKGLRLGGELVLGDWRVERDASGLLLRHPSIRPYRLPTAAVVAVVSLREVRATTSPECRPAPEELPLGDYSPGRFAWYLNNVDPLRTPVTDVKGALGLWRWTPPAGVLDATRFHAGAVTA